jgi:MFS superfamily sulfate permease-like transporter
MLALMVAACFALAWLLRLGWIADYFSRPALLGYIPCVAVVLVVGQLGKLLGLSIDARDPLCPVPKEWEHTVTVPQAVVSLNSWSVFAAMTKSLRCRPLILCVHHVTVVLPHSVSTAG